MTRSYRDGTAFWWQTISTAHLVLVVIHLVVGVWLRRPVPVLGLAVVTSAWHRSRPVAALCVIGGLLGTFASSVAWRDAVPDHLGQYSGLACLKTDPAPKGGALVVTFEIEGERFETWARGSPRRRLSDHLAGECVFITGNRRPLVVGAGRRAAVRHIVGDFQVQTLGDWVDGSPFDRASNRVRRVFARGASELRATDAALFGGLVIGDDRNEPTEMVAQFRRSGLSHLTAVSGQNVSFVLAAAAPLLRRLRALARWSVTLALIAWFAALTRFEPSVLRAGLMAAIAATGYLLGRERPATRVLTLAVAVLVVVDPLLVWSVGFWLSVGATAGVALVGTTLAAYLPGPRWLSIPAAVTIGAQCGVAPVSLLVFGTLPLVSIPANLLAVPVAGLVMLYGLPAGLVAGAVHRWLGGALAHAIQMPSAIGTRWVAVVAGLGSRFEPAPVWAAVGWVILVIATGARIVSVRLRRICQGGE